MSTFHPGYLRPCQDRAALRRVRRIAAAAALLAALAACRTSRTPLTPPDRAPPPETYLPDVSYDWHGLLIAPFGSVLKDIPAALHEVLLFRDEARGGGADEAAADAECYAADVPSPRFIGRTPEEYLLCFRQDRLFRIQASVRLTAAEAAEVFAAACDAWLKNAAQAAANAAEPGGAGQSASTLGGTAQSGSTPSASAPSAGVCEGRDGAIHFSGRLALEADRPGTLSIALDGVPSPKAADP